MSGGSGPREVGTQRPIAMWDPGKIPCKRCGRKMEPGHKSKAPGFCHDCRAADPDGVLAMTTGQRGWAS